MLCRTLFRYNCWASVKISLQYRPVKIFNSPHPMCFRNSLQGWLSSNSIDLSPISLHPSATDNTTVRVYSIPSVRNLQQSLKMSRCQDQIPVSSLVRSKPCSRIPPFSPRFLQYPQSQTKSPQKIYPQLNLLQPLS